MKHKSLLLLSFLGGIFLSCRNKKNYIHKDELNGVYKVEVVFPFNPDSIPIMSPKIKDWTLKLMDHNNFEIWGSNKAVAGYWAFTEKDSTNNSLLFQSGSMPEGIIYARFAKDSLYFNTPVWIFDSLFKGVLFKRISK
ncbi:MAG: hypothetical protein HZB42_09970 [Sphingobacteriales bacterium]|nr:hypothetical protein [Sphingobacteriales bacterium]